MRRLIIVRHAQSEANATGSLHCTVPGPPLTELGRQQAKALADQLGGEDVRSIWASTMTRAQQTAEPLAAAFGLTVGHRDGFKEAYLGELHDRRDDEAHAAFDDVYTAWMIGGKPDLSCHGGESANEVITRWIGALDEILAAHQEGAAVIVSHGASSRLTLAHLTGVDRAWILAHHLPNTGAVILDEVPGGDWACRSWAGLTPGE